MLATEARNEMIDGLEELAKWCTKAKLLKTRNKLYERLLQIDPDHATARKWLRYAKRDGKWMRPRPYREPRDYQREYLPAFRKRHAALLTRVVAPLLEAIRAGPAARRAEALDAAIRYAPEDSAVRKLNGEVKHGGRWVLRETLTALKRRRTLQNLAAKALRAVPEPKESSLTATEKRLGLTWRAVRQGQWWRGVATTDERELRNALRACDASAGFIAAALPDKKRLLSGTGMTRFNYGLYLLDGRIQGTTFCDAHPKFTERERKFSARLAGTHVPGTRQQVAWNSTERGRHDSSTRTAVAVCLGLRYGKTPGWVAEGFGMYLSHHLTGTRLTTFVERSRYARDNNAKQKIDLWVRMQARGSDWLDLAREAREPKPPDLRFLMQKGLNQMDVNDLLHSYAVAAFFIEGRPRQASRFLAAVCGEKPDIDQALASVCDLSVPRLNARVGRWLKETSRLSGG